MAELILIPDGPKNIESLFPAVDWDNVQEYYVHALDEDYSVVASSVINKLCKCNNDENVRVHFLNYLGAFDAVNFLKPKILHEDSSSEFVSGLRYPLLKTDTGIERFNVRSNDTYEVKRKSLESEMLWLQELKDSPKAYLEWKGTEGQPDSYMPIVVLNGKMEKLKNDLEYEYIFILQFKLANEFFSIRN